MFKRDIRYQGAIVQDDHILLIRYQPIDGASFWLFPGGGREDETEEACVIREMFEETHLHVQVERLLCEMPSPHSDGFYKWYKTYLCSPLGGEPRPGHEPEPGAAGLGDIVEVAWLDLRDESGWDEAITTDSITYPQLIKVRALLGYA
jgi:8-oxo-dGTP pyrophosphatase MutT (NUDIX family)